MKLYFIQQKLAEQRLNLFSSRELRRACGMTPASCRLWLIRQVKKGVILPLKRRRGLYCFTSALPHDWQVANRLYQPSCISLETALSFYGCLPEAVYGVTSVTPRITRNFEALGKTFYFHKIKQEAFGHFHPLAVEGQTVLIAEKEKALADYLYFVHLGKKTLNDRLRIGKIRKSFLKKCLRHFGRPRFLTWSHDVIRKQR